MNIQQIAAIAVRITQVIKENLEITPETLMVKILDALPDVSSDDITYCLFAMADELHIDYRSGYDILSAIQAAAKESVSGVSTSAASNSLWQGIAQTLIVVYHVLRGLIPPKWRVITDAAEDAYESLKGGKE